MLSALRRALLRLLPGVQQTIVLHAIASPLLDLVEVAIRLLRGFETVAASFLHSNASFCAEPYSFAKRPLSRRSIHLDCCQHQGQFPRR
jgi:hypothetical protein